MGGGLRSSSREEILDKEVEDEGRIGGVRGWRELSGLGRAGVVGRESMLLDRSMLSGAFRVSKSISGESGR